MRLIFKLFQLTNLQTLKPSNFEHLKHSNSKAFELSKIESFKLSTSNCLKLFELSNCEVFKLSNFQASKSSNFQTFWASNFQTPSSQTFKLEPEGCSVNLRLASSCHARCRGFKLQSWMPLQTFKLQTRDNFQTPNSQTFKLQTFHSPNFSNFQTLKSCPTCDTFKLSKIRVRKTPLVTPLFYTMNSAFFATFCRHRGPHVVIMGMQVWGFGLCVYSFGRFAGWGQVPTWGWIVCAIWGCWTGIVCGA